MATPKPKAKPAPSDPGPGAWKAPIPGTAFRDGKLIEFSATGITVIRAWPPQQWRRTRTRPWRHQAPAIDVGVCTDDELEHRIDLWQQQIHVTPRWEWNAELPAADEHGDGDADDRGLNPDGTEGTPFEDGWRSPLPRDEADGLLPSRGQLRSDIARARFLLCIPEQARLAVAPFDDSCHASLLGLLARGGPAAAELIQANPALALAVANLPLFIPELSHPWRTARSLLKRRQRDIAARLGFPLSGGVWRLLAKIHPLGLQARHLRFLRSTMGQGTWTKTLTHLPRIHAREISLVCRPSLQRLLTPALVAQTATLDPGHPGPFGTLKDTVAMTRQAYGPRATVGPFHSLAQLERVHDRLAALFARGEVEALNTEPFAEPPLPEVPGLQALKDEVALRAEAQTMANCVAAYADQVRRGFTYIYHLDLPQEPCTLSLIRGSGDRWRLGQLRGFANRQPSHSARAWVRQWLSEALGTPLPALKSH